MTAAPNVEGTKGLAGVELLWIPLGAGGHVVRLNGKLFEALSAMAQQRPAATSTTLRSR